MYCISIQCLGVSQPDIRSGELSRGAFAVGDESFDAEDGERDPHEGEADEFFVAEWFFVQQDAEQESG